MDIVLEICADIAEFVIEELCLVRDEKKKKVKLKKKKKVKLKNKKEN
ncbi:MAG: hypothetical protein HFI71_08325 [Lachnospiraceae bacterium]|nr:hypothetical protein [Lachnospiraceae bacterium]